MRRRISPFSSTLIPRSGEAANEVLKGFRGAVQTDAYAGYNPVLLPDTVERISCLAHIRRRFIDNRAFAPPMSVTESFGR